MRLGALALNLCVGLSLAGCTPALPLNALAQRRGLEISTSIQYAEGARHGLDVYRLPSARNAPVVVFFYGGSWQWGSKETYAFAAISLARQGYVAVVPDYRVYPQGRFPDFLDDGAAAVAWTKRHAREFGGDPNRLILMGHSAGAHIAAMLTFDGQWLRKVGLDSRRDVAALIGICGPYDFLPIVDPAVKNIFGGANRPQTQPITFVAGGEPPVLLLKARSDRIVDPGNSTRLAAKLRSVGSPVQEISYPYVGHITIIGTLSPLLQPLAPTLRDINHFIAHLPARQASADVPNAEAAR